MSAFTALNIEYDNTSEVAVDDTKELQIEEALKLYQSALKYHAEGPASFDKAADAYRDLFESEIFKYPESQTDFQRHQLHAGSGTADDELTVAAQASAEPGHLATSADAAPNALPQILHLAYKNHGIFLLEVLQHRIKQGLAEREGDESCGNEVDRAARVSLNSFAEALDKDDADVDLWRSAAAVAKLVGSTRIARFCLEAVLDGDEEGLDAILSLPSIDTTFALDQLRDLIRRLEDDLNKQAGPLKIKRPRRLADVLSKRLESFPEIPKTSFERSTFSLEGNQGYPPRRHILNLPRRDWNAAGELILAQIRFENQGGVAHRAGSSLGFTLPPTVSPLQAGGTLSPTPTAQQFPNEANAALLRVDPDSEAARDQPEQSNPQELRLLRSSDSAHIQDLQNESASEPETAHARVLDNESVLVDADAQVSNSRKRSTEAADLPEVAEGGRLRSKRLRARETVETGDAAEAQAINVQRRFDMALQPYVEADEWLFDSLRGVFAQLGVTAIGTASSLRGLLERSVRNHVDNRGSISDYGTVEKSEGDETISTQSGEGLSVATLDLFEICLTCSTESTSKFTDAESIDRLATTPIEYGAHSMLGSRLEALGSETASAFDPSVGLDSWAEEINNSWVSPQDVAWLYIVAFFHQGSVSTLSYDGQSSYLKHKWSKDLKQTIVHIAIVADEAIYTLMQHRLTERAELSQSTAERQAGGSPSTLQPSYAMADMAQSIFELHLDIYKRFKHPASGISRTTLQQQKCRLEKWSSLANHALNLRCASVEALKEDPLAIRHLWATAFHIGALDDVSQEHILALMHDLKHLLQGLGSPTIMLPNNAVMPELSVAAVEQELCEMNMDAFFEKIFGHDEQDPIAVIENLEPILESQIDQRQYGVPKQEIVHEMSIESDNENARVVPSIELSPPQLEVSNFLMKGNLNLRLALWQRMRRAYQSIDYPAKVISCHLRSIELIIDELLAPSYKEATSQSRSSFLLEWLATVDELVRRVFEIHKGMQDPFELIDSAHIRGSLTSLQRLSRLLHTFNVYEDFVRVGQLPAPLVDGRAKPSFLSMSSKMYSMQIRVWHLQYLLLKEAITQNPELFPTPTEARLEFLRAVHNAQGLRGICNAADKSLLKLERDELLQLSDLDGSEPELCQVLLDLYGLKCFVDPSMAADHRCPDAEQMTRTRAVKLLGFVIAQAQKHPSRDLHKTELKSAIDKIHGFLGMLKQKKTDDVLLNHRILTSFLTEPIDPANLLSSLRGTFDLPLKPIAERDAPIAAKGWYALMADVTLGKFRSQKRNQPGSNDELGIAITFLLQDLEYSSKRWEAWYDLAQCYDMQLEDCVSWSAEKLNQQFLAHGRDAYLDVLLYQRSAVHSYMMAVASAMRSGVDSGEHSTRLADLFHDFGMRVYSSSREPFAMRAFQFREAEERYFSGQTLYKRYPFKPMRLFVAWKYAAALFRKSIALSSENWTAYYMLAKCLWKMHTAPAHIRENNRAPEGHEVVNALVQAVRVVSFKKSKEPILEPHYKLTSLVHKLVQRGSLDRTAGIEALQATPYATKVDWQEVDSEWSSCVLGIIKELKNADKANWHHRMTARAAIMQYTAFEGREGGAQAARNELTQQMFTKTMQMQVWRPDNERPGRHFVYTSRYLHFFTRILIELRDRQNLELLIRRLRRKPHEYYDHATLWQETVQEYLKLLRRCGQIKEGFEDSVFKTLNHEEFVVMAERLEQWCHLPTNQSDVLEILREAMELKRMNMGLMKHTLMDDLVCDTFAKLYNEQVPTLQLAEALAAPSSKSEQPSPAGEVPLRAGPTLTEPPAVPATTRGRPKGVGRREIMRKAELCVNRPVAATIAAIPPRMPVVQVVISPKRAESSAEAPPKPSTHVVQSQSSLGLTSTTDALLISSKDREDTDSDSELSELDEEVVAQAKQAAFGPMFPGLVHRERQREDEEGGEHSTVATSDDRREESPEDPRNGEDEFEAEEEVEDEQGDADEEPENDSQKEDVSEEEEAVDDGAGAEPDVTGGEPRAGTEEAENT